MHNIFIGLAIIIVIAGLYSYSNISKVEGFKQGEAPDDRNKKLEADTKEIKDDLNVADYHADYDDMVVNLEKWGQMTRLKILVSSDVTSPEKMLDTVTRVNELSKFLENLEDCTKFLEEKT